MNLLYISKNNIYYKPEEEEEGFVKGKSDNLLIFIRP